MPFLAFIFLNPKMPNSKCQIPNANGIFVLKIWKCQMPFLVLKIREFWIFFVFFCTFFGSQYSIIILNGMSLQKTGYLILLGGNLFRNLGFFGIFISQIRKCQMPNAIFWHFNFSNLKMPNAIFFSKSENAKCHFLA